MKTRWNPTWFLLSPAVLCALSWLKLITTQSLQVDDNFFCESYYIYSNYFLSLGAIIFSFFSFQKLYDLEINEILYKRLIYGTILISSITLPMYSSDIFSILSFGTPEYFGHEIYHTYHLSSDNIYAPYVYKLYHDIPCVYGPLNIWLSKLCQISETNVVPNFVCIKFVFFLAHVSLFKLTEALNKTEYFQLDNKSIRYLPLFPLIWFEGFMQMHNDILALCLSIMGLYLMSNKKNFILSILFMSLAFAIKFNFIVLFGLYLFYTLDLRNRIKLPTVAVGLGLSALLITELYLPFVQTFGDLLLPILTIGKMGTHGSLKDIFHAIGQFFSSHELEKNLSLILYLIFFFVIGNKIVRMKPFRTIDFLLVVTCFIITIASHRFFPWYLILISFFYLFKLSEKSSWNHWLFFLSLFYMLQDLSVQIPHDTTLFHINVGLMTALGIMAIFFYFKKRFLSSDSTV